MINRYKSLFLCFGNTKEYVIRLAIQLLPEDCITALKAKYGEDLTDLSIKELDEKTLEIIRKTMYNLKKNIEFLISKNINEQEAREIFGDLDKIEELKESFYKYINTKRTNLFNYLNIEKELKKLAILLLNEKYRNIIHKRFGEELNKDNIRKLNINEIQSLATKIIPHIKDIVLFLKDKKITNITATNYLENKKLFDDLLFECCVYNIGRGTKRGLILEQLNIEDIKVLKFAMSFLSEERQMVIKKKLTENYDKEITDKYFFAVLPELKRIIKLIESKNKPIEEFTSEDIKSINEINTSHNQRYLKYKHFKDYFKEDLELAKYSVLLLTDSQKNSIYKRFGKNLDETGEVNKVFYKSINKIKLIINYLKENGINEDNIDNYRDINIVEELKNKYNQQFGTINKTIGDIAGTYGNILILAVKLLDTKEIYEIYEKYGQNLDEINTHKKCVSQKTKRNLQKSVYFLKIKSIDEEKAKEILESQTKFDCLKEEYIKFRMKSTTIMQRRNGDFYSHFRKNKDLIRLAVCLIDTNFRNLLYRKYGTDLSKPEEDLETADNLFIDNTIIPKIKNIIAYLEEIDFDEEEAKKIADNFDIIKIKELKENYNKYLTNKEIGKSTKTLEKRNDEKNKDTSNTLFDYFKENENLVRLSILFISEYDRNILYTKFNDDLNKRQTLNRNDYVYYNIFPNMREILHFLIVRNITSKQASYLISEKGEKELIELKEIYNYEKNMKLIILKQMRELINTSLYNKLCEDYDSTIALALTSIIAYKGCINISSVSEILQINYKDLLETYNEYTYKLKLEK